MNRKIAIFLVLFFAFSYFTKDVLEVSLMTTEFETSIILAWLLAVFIFPIHINWLLITVVFIPILLPNIQNPGVMIYISLLGILLRLLKNTKRSKDRIK